MTEGKSKVAETLEEFRANFAYNLLDENKRRFAAEVPFLVQWDDHETRNNWYPGQTIGIEAYKVKSASLLAAFARQAMFEYNPMRLPDDLERVYRKIAYGPLLDVFMLDERSYRGDNSPNKQPALDASSEFLGPGQLAWLKRSLLDFAGDLEADRQRHAAEHRRPRPNPDVPKGNFEPGRTPMAASPRARAGNRQSAVVHQEQRDPQRRLGHRRRALRGGFRYTPDKAAFTDFDRSGNSSPGRSTPARSAPARWTPPSAPRSSSSACRRA